MADRVVSPLLGWAGAVEASWPDTGVAAHYGEPVREQRALDGTVNPGGAGVVDRSNRGVLRITGKDRLSWLHSLTTQALEGLAAGESAQALILSPTGHVEHHLVLTDDGTSVWVHVEPGTAGDLATFLESMRFMLRVEVTDVSQEYAVLTVLGPAGAGLAAGLEPVTARVHPGSFGTIDLLVARDRLPEVAGDLVRRGAVPAGMWAFEALRIAARVPPRRTSSAASGSRSRATIRSMDPNGPGSTRARTPSSSAARPAAAGPSTVSTA